MTRLHTRAHRERKECVLVSDVCVCAEGEKPGLAARYCLPHLHCRPSTPTRREAVTKGTSTLQGKWWRELNMYVSHLAELEHSRRACVEGDLSSQGSRDSHVDRSHPPPRKRKKKGEGGVVQGPRPDQTLWTRNGKANSTLGPSPRHCDGRPIYHYLS